jgi:LacI family transcriptional regulator
VRTFSNPHPAERSSATVKDVAARASVSVATAARALGGYGRVSAATRARVLTAAADLGYQPNHVARALVSGSTMTIGLVVGDIENPFFATVARAVAKVVEPRGYTLLLANSDEDPRSERRAVETFRAQRIDGLLVAPTAADAGHGHLRDAVAAGVPLVLIDRAAERLALDTVATDNRGGAAAAVSHFAALGHERIGMLSDLPRIASSRDRIRGYREGLLAAGLEFRPQDLVVGPATRADGRACAERLLRRPRRPRALFAANNFMTIGALDAAHRLGLRIPDDLVLIGFDDFVWTTLVNPPVTVVAQAVDELGRLAGDRLLARIAGDDGPPRRISVPTELIVRGTCGTP